MNRIHRFATALALACTPLQAQESDSKTPPEGPAWTKDFFAARADALESRKPIFLYSTKTH